MHSSFVALPNPTVMITDVVKASIKAYCYAGLTLPRRASLSSRPRCCVAVAVCACLALTLSSPWAAVASTGALNSTTFPLAGAVDLLLNFEAIKSRSASVNMSSHSSIADRTSAQACLMLPSLVLVQGTACFQICPFLLSCSTHHCGQP